jgi:tetratricopeptide (TPR) repeat protein
MIDLSPYFKYNVFMSIEVNPVDPATLCTGGPCLSTVIANFANPALAETVKGYVSTALDGIKDAADSFKDRLLLEASDLLFKINEVQKFLDLADCFKLLTQFETGSERVLNPFAQFDPALKKGLEYKDKAVDALQSVEDGINAVANLPNVLYNQVEEILEGVDASALSGKLAEAYSYVQGYVDEYQKKAEDVQAAISIYNKALDTASCLGLDPTDSKIADELFKLGQKLTEFSDAIDSINQRIEFIEGFLSGNGCINLTC